MVVLGKEKEKEAGKSAGKYEKLRKRREGDVLSDSMFI